NAILLCFKEDSCSELYGTTKNAFSCALVSNFFESPLAVTTLLVPTSRPMRVREPAPACVPPLVASPDSAPKSVLSSIDLPSLVLSLRTGFTRNARLFRSVLRPFLIALLPLAAHLIDGCGALARFVYQQLIRGEQTGPRLAERLQEIIVVAEPEQRYARRRLRVLVRQAERLERESARTVEVIPDERARRVHARQPVCHAHFGRDRETLSQVMRQVAACDQLRTRDRQRSTAFPTGLEGDAEKGIVQIEIHILIPGPNAAPGVVCARFVLDDAVNAPEAIDQIVVRLLTLHVLDQARGAAAQLVPVTFLERPQVAFRGVKEDSDRLRMQLLLRPKLAVMHDIASLLACHREARLDA